METKRKSEKIIFWGFVFLAISFIAMIIFFQYQSDQLNKKGEALRIREARVKILEKEVNTRNDEIEKIKEIVPDSFQSTVDEISQQANEQIKNETQQIAIEYKIENIIYVQVSSNITKSNLINQNFISSLNSKGYNVINAYDIAAKGVDNTIRYFNEEDKGLAEQLKSDIQNEFSISLTPRFVKGYKVNKGQIEIWIK